jgi:hypothetical protein
MRTSSFAIGVVVVVVLIVIAIVWKGDQLVSWFHAMHGG